MFSKKQAQRLYDSEIYKDMDPDQIVKFQIDQDWRVVPYQVFHECLEIALDRTVLEYEIAYKLDDLKKEFRGEKKADDLSVLIIEIPALKQAFIDWLHGKK